MRDAYLIVIGALTSWLGIVGAEWVRNYFATARERQATYERLQLEILREIPQRAEELIVSARRSWNRDPEYERPRELTDTYVAARHALQRLRYAVDDDELHAAIEELQTVCDELLASPEKASTLERKPFESMRLATIRYDRVVQLAGEATRRL